MSDMKMTDPTMPTDPVEPPYARKGFLSVLLAEIWDHLWPWSRHGFRRQTTLQAAGVALAVAATLTWVYAAMGRMEAGAIVGWWFGWSVFEVVVRLGSKPYVKEGPWWGRSYRRANLMDMICYVGFKNLLIGAVLFIALKSQGILVL
jgi:hypothetical protein